MENKETMQFGVHYMLDGYNANPDIMRDKEALTAFLHDLPGHVGMHSICEPTVVEVGPNNKKDPGGVSGFVMIAESHISFHTFPGRGFVSIDVYTCNDTVPENELTKRFTEFFKICDSDVKVIERGTRYPSENIC